MPLPGVGRPRFSGRRPATPPNDARRPSEPGGSAGKLPGTQRARRGGHPPKSHPRMELTELRESAAPGRGDGQGARGAAGGRTAGPGAREGASRRGLFENQGQERRKARPVRTKKKKPRSGRRAEVLPNCSRLISLRTSEGPPGRLGPEYYGETGG